MLAKTITLYKDSFAGLSKEIWMLSTVMLINRTGAMVLPFVTIYMTQVLGFTKGQTGIVMSCYGLGSFVAMYVGGKLADTIGAYWTQLGSLMLSGIGFFVLMMVESFAGFCAMYFLLVLVADAFRPANMAAVGIYSKPENRTRSLSLIRLAINMGYGTGSLVGGLLAVSIGYKGLFVIDGLTCILAGFLFIMLLPRKEEEKVDIEVREEVKTIQSPYKDKKFIFFCLTLMMMATAFLQLIFMFPLYLKEVHHLNEDVSGMLMFWNCIILVIIELPLIFSLEKRKASKLKWTVIGAILIAIGHFAFLLPMSIHVLVWLYIIWITLGEIMAFPFSNTWSLDRSEPANRGQYMGMYGMAWSLAFIVAPTLGMTLVEDIGWNYMWALTGSFCIFAALGFQWLKSGESRKEALT